MGVVYVGCDDGNLYALDSITDVKLGITHFNFQKAQIIT